VGNETKLGVAQIPIRADLKDLDKDLDSARSKVEGALSGAAGKIAGTVGKVAAVGLGAATAAVAGLGAASFKAGMTYDEAMDRIRTSTGASDEVLSRLGQDFDRVFTSIPTQAGPAADVIGELHKRLDITGDSLVDLSKPMLEMTRLLGGDAVTNTQLFTRVMGDWGISNEDAAGALDRIFVASQKTGVGVETLMQRVVQFGSPMRLMGFTIEDSISLFSKWEKEGVNAELVMGSLRIAAGKFARDGKPLRESLLSTFDSIQKNTDASAALALGMEVFGARAGPDMVAAIREGRFNIEELTAAMDGADGKIMETAGATADWGERWQVTMNKLTTAMAPLGLQLMDLVGVVVEHAGPAFDALGGVLSTVAGAVSSFAGGFQAAVERGLGPFDAVVWGVMEALDDFLPEATVNRIWDFVEGAQTVVAALQDFGRYLLAVISDGDTMNDWLTHLPASFQPVAEAIGEVVNAIKENMIPILAGVAAAILYVAVPAFVAWASAAWAAATATIAAMAPVVAPIVAIGAAVALLAVAWKNDFLGIRTAVTEFWEGTVKPAFEAVKTWLEAHLPQAVEAVKSAWNTAWTAIKGVMTTVWEGHLKPAFESVRTWLETNVPKAIGFLTDAWENVLLPAIKSVWDFIQTSLVPLFEALSNVVIAALKLALTALQGIFENVLLPAIEDVWEFLSTSLVPLFTTLYETVIVALQSAVETLAGVWRDDLKPALDDVWGALDGVRALVEGAVGKALSWFKDSVVAPLAGAFDGISGAISSVIGWLNDLAGAITSVKLPDWMTPGSPTPFEMGMWGIADAVEHVAGQSVPALGAALGQVEDPLETMRRLIDDLIARGLDRASGLGAAMKAIGEGLQAGVAALSAVGGYESGALRTAWQAFSDDLQFVADKLQWLAEYFAGQHGPAPSLVSAKAVMDAVSGAMQPLQTAVGALVSVNEYTEADNMPERWAAFERNLGAAVETLARLAGRVAGPARAAARQFTEGIGDALSVLGQAVAGIKSVASFEDVEDFGAKMRRLADLVGVAVLEMGRVRNWRTAIEAWQQASVWALAVGPAVELLSKAVAAVGAVSDLDAQHGKFGARVERLASMVGVAVLALADVRNWRASIDAWASASEWAEKIGPAVDFIAGAVAAVGAVADLDEQRGNFGAAVKRLASMIGVAVLALADVRNWRDSIDVWQGASEWAVAVRDAVGLLSEAVTAVNSLFDLKTMGDFEERVATFTEYLRLALQAIVDISDDYAGTVWAAAGTFAESARQAVGLVAEAVEALTALSEWGTENLTPEKIDVFTDVVRYTVEMIAWTSYQIMPVAVQAAVDFAGKASTVFSAMKEALDFLGSLKDATLPDRDKISAFLDLLRDILGDLQEATAISGAIAGNAVAMASNLDVAGITGIGGIGGVSVPIARPVPYMPWDVAGHPARPGGGGGGGSAGGNDRSVELLTQIRDLTAEIAEKMGIEPADLASSDLLYALSSMGA
jgi:TP901 family phage tail tape measure protein